MELNAVIMSYTNPKYKEYATIYNYNYYCIIT